MARLADFNTDNTFQATVLQSVRLTPANTEEIRELLLEVERPGIEFQVDQSFGVLVEARAA